MMRAIPSFPPLEWIDISRPLGPHTPVWPGDLPVSLDTERWTNDAGRTIEVRAARLSLHAGTHMDAPRHFFPEGISIDQLPAHKLMGEAVWLDLGYLAPGSQIQVADLAPFKERIRRGDIVVLYTAYEDCADDEKYCSLAPEAAQWLVDKGIKCLAMDVPSVDPVSQTGGPASRQTHPAHHVVLGAGIPIVEGLVNLKSLPDGRFHFFCLPLKIAGGDGSPVRAVALDL
jgi:arylformamidase